MRVRAGVRVRVRVRVRVGVRVGVRVRVVRTCRRNYTSPYDISTSLFWYSRSTFMQRMRHLDSFLGMPAGGCREIQGDIGRCREV